MLDLSAIAARRYDLKLNFLEAVFGFSSEIDISRLVTCETCDGSGVKAGTTPSGCGWCGGQGQVVSQVRTPLGTFNQVRAAAAPRAYVCMSGNWLSSRWWHASPCA